MSEILETSGLTIHEEGGAPEPIRRKRGPKPKALRVAACGRLGYEFCHNYLASKLDGCRADKAAMMRVGLQNCAIFQCAQERGNASCAQCSESPCVFHQHLERICPGNTLRRLGDLTGRLVGLLNTAIGHRLALCTEQLRRQNDVLGAMGYKSVLGRGFSITRLKKGRTLIRSRGQLRDGQRIVTQVADGEFESQVVDRSQLELFE